MAHSDVTKDEVTKTIKVNYMKLYEVNYITYMKVGIKGSKTLKTAHRYEFLFPSYGQLKTEQCSPPEL